MRLPQAVSKEFVGESIGMKKLKKGETISECEDHCDKLKNCQSFNFNKWKKECYFKNKALTGDEPLMCRDDLYTVYRSCYQGNNLFWNCVLPSFLFI